MPPGVPVAAVGLDRGDNAALLAIQILALEKPGLQALLRNHKESQQAKVLRDSAELGA
jgi:5-(carboxyamino)imidazole ribonucleotide mutase